MNYLSRLGLSAANYDKAPTVKVPAPKSAECWAGWDAIVSELSGRIFAQAACCTLAIECYPGVDFDALLETLRSRLRPARLLDTRRVFKSGDQIDAMIAPFLGGDDPIFGYLKQTLLLSDFLDPGKVREQTKDLGAAMGLTLVVGPGAFLIAPEAHVRVYADMPRWEGQLRQRRGEADNLGVRNRGYKASLQYKRSFFVDWRVADRLKMATMDRWDYLLDTTNATPKLITSAAHLAGIQAAVSQPFRVVPFFDPGPWGGQWMREVCQLPDGPPNYAWCFDCVP